MEPIAIENGLKYGTAQTGPNPPGATGMNAFCDRKVFCYKGFNATGCGTDNVKCVAMSDFDKQNMNEDGGGRGIKKN
jgi:hypothetical protein